MDTLLDALQWPALAVTLAATWLMAARSRVRRNVAFWLFLASNALWAIWGWHDGAVALVLMQAGLAGLNIRGVMKTEPPGDAC